MWRGAGASSCGPAVSCIPGLPGEGRGPPGGGSQWGLCGVSVKSQGGGAPWGRGGVPEGGVCGSAGTRWGPRGGGELHGVSVNFQGGGLRGVSVMSRWGRGSAGLSLQCAIPGALPWAVGTKTLRGPSTPATVGSVRRPLSLDSHCSPGVSLGRDEGGEGLRTTESTGQAGQGPQVGARSAPPWPRLRGSVRSALGPAPRPWFRSVPR